MNRLTVESLEARDVPAWFFWVGDNNPATTGYLPWYTASYWEGGVPPNNTTGADFINIRAGADKIALAGDFAGITTTAGDSASVLVKDGNTLKIRDLEVYLSAPGRTTFMMESNTTIVLAGPISARGGVVFDNSGGLAGNTHLLIDNAGQPMPTIGLLDRDGLIINGVDTVLTAGSTLMLWGNNGVGQDAGYIKFTSPTTNPATFTNNGSLYMTRRATVAFQSDFINYGYVAVQKSSSIVSHLLNGDTGTVDIPADSAAKIGWVGTSNQDLDNYGLVKIEADGTLGADALSLLSLQGNRGAGQRGNYNDYGSTVVYCTTAVEPNICEIKAHAVVLSQDVVTFSGTAGRGVLTFTLTDEMSVYGTVFNHTYSTLFDQVDNITSNANYTFGGTPTFNVAGGPLQTGGPYTLLGGPAILGGVAQPGTIPANAVLEQNASSVYLRRITRVAGRFFRDGVLDAQNAANNVDMNALDDHPAVGVANQTVWLYSTSNPYSPAYTTTTDAYGNYAFANVAEGEYTIVFNGCQWYDAVDGPYDGYDMAAPFVTTGDSDVDPYGMAVVDVGTGDQLTVNAGIYAVRL